MSDDINIRRTHTTTTRKVQETKCPPCPPPPRCSCDGGGPKGTDPIYELTGCCVPLLLIGAGVVAALASVAYLTL